MEGGKGNTIFSIAMLLESKPDFSFCLFSQIFPQNIFLLGYKTINSTNNLASLCCFPFLLVISQKRSTLNYKKSEKW